MTLAILSLFVALVISTACLAAESTEWPQQGFDFGWNNPLVPVGVPISGHCRNITVNWFRGSGVGPYPQAPYIIELYSSTSLTPIVLDAGNGTSKDLQIPFSAGAQYVLCMTDSSSVSGGCSDLYTVYPSPITCPDVTSPGTFLNLNMTLDSGAPLSRYGWPPRGSDILFNPTNGSSPYTLSIIPTSGAPLNSTFQSTGRWTVSLDPGQAFFVSVVDSRGVGWVNGPLHVGNGTLVVPVTTSKNSWLDVPVLVGISLSLLIVGLMIGALCAWCIFNRLYRRIGTTISNVERSGRDKSPSPTRDPQEKVAGTKEDGTDISHNLPALSKPPPALLPTERPKSMHSLRDRFDSQGTYVEPTTMKSTTTTAIGVGTASTSVAAGQRSTMSHATGAGGVEQSLSAGGHQRNNTMESPVSSAEPLPLVSDNGTFLDTLAERNPALAFTAPTGTVNIAAGGHQNSNMMKSESHLVSPTETLSFPTHNDAAGNTLTGRNILLAITPPEPVVSAPPRGPEPLEYSPMVSTPSNPTDSKTRRPLPKSDPNIMFEPKAFSDIRPDQYKPYDRVVYDADLRVQKVHVIFILDRSGSMDNSDKPPPPGFSGIAIAQKHNNRWGAVLTAFLELVETSKRLRKTPFGSSQDAYSCILFNHTVISPFAYDEYSTGEALLQRLLTTSADGGTNFASALSEAKRIMGLEQNKDRVPAIIFLSDGEDRISDDAIRSLCRSASQHPLAFYTVSFGMQDHSQSLKQMANIAAEEYQAKVPRAEKFPCGFLDVLNTTQLENIFLEIAESIRPLPIALTHR